MRRRRLAVTAGLAFAVLLGISMTATAKASGGTVTQLTSTVPGNGDVNPYGVAVVPHSIGNLVRGDVLVSNFNDSGNLQGTGSTIDQISPAGTVTQFASISDPSCPGGVGLSTALVVLRNGWVIVGSLPTTDGLPDTIGAGCLIVLDSTGAVRETIAGHGINGPWDMTARDLGGTAQLFVTNVLNGTVQAGGQTVNGGTVLRINIVESTAMVPQVQSITQIGSGFAERTDPAALVVGPTGIGLGAGDMLYVADSVNSRIAAIPEAAIRTTDAGTGSTFTQGGHINDPLGLAIAAGGNVLTVNGADGNMVETTLAGVQSNVTTLDTNNGGGGNLFGLAVNFVGTGTYFVDDFNNTLNIVH